MSGHALLNGLKFSQLLLNADRSSRDSVASKADEGESTPDDDASDHRSPASSAPIAVQGSRQRRSISSKSDLTFEEQVALKESQNLSIVPAKPSHHSDDPTLESVSASPKSSGFGLRGMVARMFHRGATAAPSDSSAAPAANAADAAGVLALSHDEIMARNLKANAELIFDSPFDDLSRWLLRKRHKILNSNLCSLDWLTRDGGIEFEDKTLRMKVPPTAPPCCFLSTVFCCCFTCRGPRALPR